MARHGVQMASAVAVLLSGVAVTGGVAGFAASYVAWRHREHPAAMPFAKQSALASIWGFIFALLVFVRDPGVASLLISVAGAVALLLIVYFFEFTVTYTGRGEWLTPRRHRTLLAVFGAFALLTLVDPWTGLLRSSVTMQTTAGLTLPVVERTTTLLLFELLVAYPPVLAGVGLLGEFLLSERNVYRKQTAAILGTVLFTALGSVVSRSGLTPHAGLDLTPIFYAFEAVVIASVLFYYDFLDVEPLAPEIVLNEMQDPVFVLDDAGVVRRNNPAATSLIDRERPVGAEIDDLLPGLQAITDGGTDVEYVSGDGDGESVYDLSSAPIRDQFDRERGSVLVFRNVTLQKQREETLEALQSVSQQFLTAETREAVTRIAVEAANTVLGYPYSGVVLHDEDENVLRGAAVADALFDAYAATETGDVPTSEVTRIDGTETMRMPVVPPSGSDLWTVFESGEPMLGGSITPNDDRALPDSLGESLLFPLGEHGVLGITSAADHEEFSDEDRRFARVLAAATENALDRVSKESALRESRALLEERTEQIQFFNSVLRHDLLNGMNVVQARATMLEDHVEDSGDEHLATIEDYVDDIVTLTQKVRSVTGAITDDEDDLRSVDLATVVAEKAAKLDAGHGSATIETAVDEVRVPGDDLLPEVIENLVLNGIEHNDNDRPRITIRTVEVDDELHVRIADNGPGVPEELTETVFQKDVTSDDSGTVGFGLYFVDVMMDRYGGTVWFEDGDVATARPDGTTAELDEPDGAVAVLSFPTDHPLARQQSA